MERGRALCHDAQVTVTFAGQEKSAKADMKGKWRVDLDPMPASKNLTVDKTYPGAPAI